MEAAVDMALTAFRGVLLTKLRTVLEEELAARTTSLDLREAKLEARSTELILIEQALALGQREAAPQQPAVGPGLFASGISRASLQKPPMATVVSSAPQLGLATRPSLLKPGQALQHQNRSDAPTEPTRAGEPRAMPTYQLPLQQVPEQSYSFSPGSGPRNSVASSLAASARFEVTATLSGNHFRVPSPASTVSGAQTPQTPQTHRVRQILTAHRMPPSQAAPLTYQQWAQGSPVAIPAPPLCRSPCQSPRRVVQNMEPQAANRRAASMPARIKQVSEWSFLVPRGSVGPTRAEFDGGQMFRALDRERTGSIGPEEVAEYIETPRHNCIPQAVQHPIHSPRQLVSPPASPRVALPVLGGSASMSNLASGTPAYGVRRSHLDREPTASPALSEMGGRSTLGGWSQGSPLSREHTDRGRERLRWPEIHERPQSGNRDSL